jgi:hypothetical protein
MQFRRKRERLKRRDRRELGIDYNNRRRIGSTKRVLRLENKRE